MSDYLKWFFVAVIAVAGMFSSYFYMDQSFVLRFGLLLVLTFVATLIGFTTSSGAEAWQLVKAAPNEIRKVSWPQKNETIQLTIIILIMVTILMLLVWAIDSLLLKFISIFTGQGV